MAEDRDIISKEDHELNYLLKKWGKKTNSANRKILSDALDGFNDDNSFKVHNRENFYKFVEQNKIIDSMESGAKKDPYTLTEVTGDFKTKAKDKKSILWLILLIIMVIIIIFFIIFGLKYCGSIKSEKSTEIEKTTDQNEEINKRLSDEAAKKAELEKISKISEIIKQNTPVYFVKDRSILIDGEENKVNNLIVLLKEFNNVNFIIEGHTANIGLPENEMKLSMERADKIKQMLENGLRGNSYNFTVKGYGAQVEAVPNSDKTNWHLNRRVEIKTVL